MAFAPTPCLETGCPNHASYKGRCPQHQPPPWQGTTRGQRLPPDWNTRRIIVMKRDGGICHVCKGPNADEIDHVIAGDDHSLTNLAPIHQAVPPHCHRTKSSAEGNAAKSGNRSRPRR